MTIVDRYLARFLAAGWLLVFSLLTVFFGLFVFIDELDRVMADYQPLQVLQYVALILPQLTLDLFPVITLLGTLIALALLSRNSEMVVILTSGISTARLLLSVSLPAGLLMVLLWPLSEYVAAPLYQQGEAFRQQARTGTVHALPEEGLWSADGNRYYHLGKLYPGPRPADITIFQFDDEGALISTLHAEYAEIVSGRTWQLYNIRSKRLLAGDGNTGREILTEYEADRLEDGFWSQDELAAQLISPASMSLRNLYHHMEYLKGTRQPIGGTAHMFWQRLTLPLISAMMVLLALQLSTSMVRSRNQSFGLQVGIGIAVGIFFYLISQVIYAGGLLLGINAPLVAATPILMVLAATALLQYLRP